MSSVFGCEVAAFNESEDRIQSWKQAVFIYFSPRIYLHLEMKLKLP